MATYNRVHDYACVLLWAWWEVVAAHQRVHDYACVSLWAWWEVVAAHQRVHDYACVAVGQVGRWRQPTTGYMTMHMCRCGPGARWWQPTTGFMTMHVCQCGPGGRWWQPTNGFMTMHVCRCGPGGRWWQPTRYDYACVLLLAWWEVAVAHHRVYDYACCHIAHANPSMDNSRALRASVAPLPRD